MLQLADGRRWCLKLLCSIGMQQSITFTARDLDRVSRVLTCKAANDVETVNCTRFRHIFWGPRHSDSTMSPWKSRQPCELAFTVRFVRHDDDDGHHERRCLDVHTPSSTMTTTRSNQGA